MAPHCEIIRNNQKLFATDNLTMLILPIFLSQSYSEVGKKRDVVYVKLGHARFKPHPFSGIVANGANHYASVSQPFLACGTPHKKKNLAHFKPTISF